MKVAAGNLRRLLLIVYKIILPIAMGILLFVLSSAIPRPRFFGSDISDFLARVLVWLWFSWGYRSLPTLHEQSASRMDRLRIHFSSDLAAGIYYFVGGVGFSLGISLMMWWIIRAFVPVMSALSVPIAVLNGLLYFFPIALNYRGFKAAVHND